jgi:hypothetical protein
VPFLLPVSPSCSSFCRAFWNSGKQIRGVGGSPNTFQISKVESDSGEVPESIVRSRQNSVTVACQREILSRPQHASGRTRLLYLPSCTCSRPTRPKPHALRFRNLSAK